MDRPIGLYVHIPFCERKCTYCDFNSYSGQNDLIPAYTAALVREIELWGASEPFAVKSVFFGGGTPSELPLEHFATIVEAIAASFRLQRGAEFTVEANPGTVDRAYLAGLLALGVNRLSLGVQSFDDAELAALTRIHTAEEARRAFDDARAAGFRRINLDLIYGLAHQGLDRWSANVAAAVAMSPEHLSLYALSVEPGTALFQQVRAGRTPGPDPDLQAEMYEYTVAAMAGAGYRRYEISNWAREDEECRHNLVYWRNEPYLGVGCGAHSSLGGRRFNVVNPPRHYIAAMRAAVEGDPWLMPQLENIEQTDEAARLAETLMLGLRLDEGVRLDTLAAEFPALLPSYAATFARFDELGLLRRDGETLRLTDRGVLLSNEVFEEILVPSA